MAIKRRGYDSDSDGNDRPFKIPCTRAAIRLDTINNIASTNRSIGEERDYLLRERKAAYATNDRLQKRLSAKEMFGSDEKEDIADLSDTGSHTILSSKCPGGVHYMRQQYYDLMAIVRQFGKPDLFITVTTNSKWPEIQDNLLPASDRPDIVSRVFNLKPKAILEDTTSNRVFGDLQAYVYVIKL
ncbi:Helitron helicase-like domain-containing protein [Phytophthora infestans]|uniref:Helitron helicase-like domain at N-terminus n=1 Tax=Phytophthora infestans TaxID=4787 RepID=A0A833SAW4_PHYIN|nr:Helitron helicase-like domain-containing protein [Phytophthora infestans]KAF4146445.1 Helitron helicase-like domain at N-terminus [Phytophthora infestans]